MNRKYKWIRYWQKKDENLRYIDGFIDIRDEYEIYSNIHKKQCIVLLGDAGIGKSTELKNMFNFELTSKNDFKIFKEMKLINNKDSLESLLFEDKIFREWKNSKNNLYLYLDGIDESLDQSQNIVDILSIKLENFDINSIYVRMTCRIGLFSDSIEVKLKNLFEDNNVEILKLAPLTIENIKESCKEEDIDSDKFIKEIMYKNLQAFATFPITLKTMIYEYKESKNLSGSKVDIYKRCCETLCKEINSFRKRSKVIKYIGIERRMDIAKSIAAVTILCNKNYIVLDEFYNEELDIDKFIQIINKDYSPEEVEETLNTSLFTKENDKYYWNHRSYAEFLAAYYIKDKDFEINKIKSIISQDNQEVIPQLYQLSSWVSTMNKDIFNFILDNKPSILLLSDLGHVNEVDKELIVQYILKDMECYKYINPFISKQLYHKKIYTQIVVILKDKNIDRKLKCMSLDIIYQCGIEEFTKDVFDILNDYCYYTEIVYRCIKYIETYMSIYEQKKILDLQYVEDNYKQRILKNLYPRYINYENIVKYFEEIRCYDSDIYNLIIGILDKINLVDLIKVMKLYYFESVKTKNYNDIIDIILMFSWKYIYDINMFNTWIEMARDRIKKNNGILINKNSFANSEFYNLKIGFNKDFENRIDISIRIKYEDENIYLGKNLFDKQDLDNIKIKFEESEDILYRWKLILICKDMFKGEEDYYSLSNYLDTLEYNSVKILCFDEILELKLKCEKEIEDNKNKKIYIIENNIKNALRYMNLDIEKNWIIFIDNFLEDFYFMLNVFEYSLTNAKRWEKLNYDEQCKILNYAKKFIIDFNKENVSEHNYVIFAIQLIYEMDKEFIINIDLYIKDKILNYIIDAQTDSYLNGMDIFKWLYKYKPSESIGPSFDELSRHRTIGSWSSGRYIAENRISVCYDSFISKKLKYYIDSKPMSCLSKGDFIRVFLSRCSDEDIKFIINIIDIRYESISRYKTAIEAACVILRSRNSYISRKLINLLDEDKLFMIKVFRRFIIEKDLKNSFESLDLEELSRIYIFICDNYSHIKRNKKLDVDFLKERIIDKIIDNKELDNMEELYKLKNKIKLCSVINKYWDRIKIDYFTLKWEPLNFDQFKIISQEKNKYFIYNETQLLDIIKSILEKFQYEMDKNENPIVGLLWNKNKDIYNPKNETLLSDFIKWYIEKELERYGVILNREVEIYHKERDRPGERIDIKVDIPKSNMREKINLYIEVKGCWNDGLMKSMKSQLKDRYMDNRDKSYGIYLVGWYGCENSIPTKKCSGKCKYNDLNKLRMELDYQSKEIFNQYGADIRSIVLDLSLK